MKNYLFISSFIFILFACGKKDNKTVKPVMQNITETVFASGVLEPNEKYNLTAQADGYLSGINFNEGDLVSENQVLGIVDNKTNAANVLASKEQLSIATFNTTENAPALKQLKNNIEFAEQKVQQDMQQYLRYKSLYESNSVSKVELENMKLAVENSEASLDALKEQYENTKQQAKQALINQKASNQINEANAAYNQIKTLVAGKVLKRMKQNGDYIRRGDIIATIGKPNTTIAKLNVDENSISKIKLGQKVLVQLNVQKDKVYEGVVTEILPMFDEQIQSFVCKVMFKNNLDFNIAGTQLEANIEVGTKQNVMLIPRLYLGFGNKVKLKGKDELITVKTGIISTEWAEITSGLTLNDEIVPLKP